MASNIKQAAHDLIESLPSEASWDDVIYEMVVRREIDAGLEDSEASRVVTLAELRKEFEVDD